MKRTKLIFLAFVLLITPGYRFRCWVFCSDQTAVQTDYTEARDHCRDYASLKLDMAVKNYPGPADSKTRKALLVSLFSDCMNKEGWNVPGALRLEEKAESENPAAPVKAAPAATAESPVERKAASAEERAALLRSSECNFARYSSSTSSIAAARAKACDLECAERLKAAPEAPRPAACPAGTSPIMAKGRDIE